MRFSLTAVAVAGVGIAQVAATPIRIIVSTETFNVSGNRADHAVASYMIPSGEHHPVTAFGGMAIGHGGARPGCAGGRMNRFRQKGVEISNAFRKALGWPLIEPYHKEGHVHHSSMPVIKYKANHIPEGAMHILPVGQPFVHDEHPVKHFVPPQRGRIHHHHHHDRSFLVRLQQSLMNLGRWEGRAVAFVLGCGIGVLLRMFWVLSVVFIRSIKGPKEETHEYTHITIFEQIDEDDNTAVPPPTYTYPVDEKVAIDVEPPKTTEEAK